MRTTAKDAVDARVSGLAPDDPRHGTNNGYGNLKCRCDRCREAHRVYCLDQNHRHGRHKPAAVFRAELRAAAEARENHGTETRYVSLGCRCDECKEAAAAARRDRRKHANPARHGSVGYRNGCRCDECRTAWAAFWRARHLARRAEAA